MTRISFVALAGALALAALPALAQTTPPVSTTPSVAVGSDSKTDVQTGSKASTTTMDSKTKIGAQIGQDKIKTKLPPQTAQHSISAPKADTSVNTDTSTSK